MSSSPMPWIKLYTETLDDTKFGTLSDGLKWRFVELCLLAGQCDAEGYLVNGEETMTIDDIAWRLRRDPEDLAADLEILKQRGFIAYEDGAWLVTNFGRRQGRPQHERREVWRRRKQEQREREADMDSPADKTDHPANVTPDSPVTPGPREEKSREEKSSARTPATPSGGSSPPRQRGKTPPAVAVFRENAHRYPAKSWYENVANTIGDEPGDLEFWGSVVKDWVGKGYNPVNVKGMLSCYEDGKLPGGEKRDGQPNVIKVGR